MSNITAILAYNVKMDIFEVSGNAKEPKKLVAAFIESQIGAGIDYSKRVEKTVYNIKVELDTSDGSFYITHDCRNKGLRDGILMHFLGGTIW